jgi:hypothetical protein
MRFFDPTGGAIWPYAVVYMAEYLANPNVLQQVHVDNRSVWSVRLKCSLSLTNCAYNRFIRTAMAPSTQLWPAKKVLVL